MNREQKIARAKELRAEGMTYGKIAAKVGSSYATVYRWLNPDYIEKQRQASREWKARNKKHCAKYDKEYKESHRGECSQCGGEMDRYYDGGVCSSCRFDNRDRRARKIERWWAEGLSIREIADRLAWSEGSLSREMGHLRRMDYDLPYRYRVKGGKRVKAR